MGESAISGHLGRWTADGVQIPEQMNWSLSATGRAPEGSSGDDTAKVLLDDEWQEGAGSAECLVTPGGDALSLNDRIAAVFYILNQWTVETSAAGLADIVTLNGTDYTNAAATDVTANEWADAAGLVLAINNRQYGSAPAFKARAVGTLVTIWAIGDIIELSKTESGGTLTLADTSVGRACEIKIMGVELNPSQNTGEAQPVTYNYETSGEILKLNGTAA